MPPTFCSIRAGGFPRIRSAEDLARMLAQLHNQGYSSLIRVSVFADQKKSDINALYASQGGQSSSRTLRLLNNQVVNDKVCIAFRRLVFLGHGRSRFECEERFSRAADGR
jgi:hypothetical protein